MAGFLLFGYVSADSRTSKRLATGKTSFDIAPALELISLIGLPAEQHHATIAHRRKIDQTLLIVFELDSKALKLAGLCRQFDEQFRVTRTERHAAATMFGAGRGLPGRGLKSNQTPMRFLNRPDDWPNGGKKGIGFVDGE